MKGVHIYVLRYKKNLNLCYIPFSKQSTVQWSIQPYASHSGLDSGLFPDADIAIQTEILTTYQ